MSDVRVPVKAWLRGPTYRKLDKVAKQRGFADVGSLLEQLAERALTPQRVKPKRVRTLMTDERIARMKQLKAENWKQHAIAKELGVSDATVSVYLNHGGWSS
jgi:DNA invertase Pin-like site-specific DNA recombinase